MERTRVEDHPETLLLVESFVRCTSLLFLLKIFIYLFLLHLALVEGFPGGPDGKESPCNVGDLGSIPGWEDPLEKGMATHSSIPAWRIPMDRGAWWAIVRGVAKNRA